MSPEIINAKVHLRYLECIWRKSHTHHNRCHFCNRLMNKAKSDFYRYMWNYINRTLHRKASVPLMIRLIHSAILFQSFKG